MLLASTVSAATVQWTRQFGTSGYEVMFDMDAHAGITVVLGVTDGQLPSSDGEGEFFLRAYSTADGALLWAHQLGSLDINGEELLDVAVDDTGVSTIGALPASAAGTRGGFLRRYDLGGAELWTRSFAPPAGDLRSVDSAGDTIAVIGATEGQVGGHSWGRSDIFVRAFETSGDLRWTRQFGTRRNESPVDVLTDGVDVYAIGHTGGTFPWQRVHTKISEGFMIKLGPRGGVRWDRRIDGPGGDIPRAASIDDAGIAVTGFTSQGLPGAERLFGGGRMFVRRLSLGGKVSWTRTFGSWSAFEDDATGVASSPTDVSVVGETGGVIPGASGVGGYRDGFVVTLDAAGSVAWVEQFGSRRYDTVVGGARDGAVLVVAGSTGGALVGTSHGRLDAYVRAYAP